MEQELIKLVNSIVGAIQSQQVKDTFNSYLMLARLEGISFILLTFVYLGAVWYGNSKIVRNEDSYTSDFDYAMLKSVVIIAFLLSFIPLGFFPRAIMVIYDPSLSLVFKVLK